jgi:hypothetical protein
VFRVDGMVAVITGGGSGRFSPSGTGVAAGGTDESR